MYDKHVGQEVYQALLKDSLHLVMFPSNVSLVMTYYLLTKLVLHHFTLLPSRGFLQRTQVPRPSPWFLVYRFGFLDHILTPPLQNPLLWQNQVSFKLTFCWLSDFCLYYDLRRLTLKLKTE